MSNTIDLGAFIASAIKKQPKGKGAKAPRPKASEREIRLKRTYDSRWADEALVLIVNRVLCLSCGEQHTAPVPRLFLRRYHPKWGIHEMALEVAPQAPMLSSPPRVEYHDDTCPVCHLCLTPEINGRSKQLPFDFKDALLDPLNTKKELTYA